MNSNKQKRKLLKLKRLQKKEASKRDERRMVSFNLLPVDRSKIVSASLLFNLPAYYEDYPFVCRDCGSHQLWTARQQKWWYEEVGGEWESIAVRCRPCRAKERLRREKARKIHLEGLAQKELRNKK
ncbi:zinc-ribbon domain containing protein [Rubritalea sp.]|uniref:zinc-ribbon domain containing protein n=1 Tax=Rubritalea sp. TaxID=2109375 RepID=UPI003EF548A8